MSLSVTIPHIYIYGIYPEQLLFYTTEQLAVKGLAQGLRGGSLMDLGFKLTSCILNHCSTTSYESVAPLRGCRTTPVTVSLHPEVLSLFSEHHTFFFFFFTESSQTPQKHLPHFSNTCHKTCISSPLEPQKESDGGDTEVLTCCFRV